MLDDARFAWHRIRRDSTLNVRLAPRSISAFTRSQNVAMGRWVKDDAGAPYPLPLEALQVLGLDASKMDEIVRGIDMAGGDEAILPPMLWVFDEDAWKYLTDPMVVAVLRSYCPQAANEDWRHQLRRVGLSAHPDWRNITEDLVDAGVLPDLVLDRAAPRPVLWAGITHRLWTGLEWKAHPASRPDAAGPSA